MAKKMVPSPWSTAHLLLLLTRSPSNRESILLFTAGELILKKTSYVVHNRQKYIIIYIRRKDTILVCYYSQQTRSKHNLRKHEVNVQEKMFFGEACHVHVKLDGVVTETTVKNNLRSMSPNLK